MGTIVSFRIGQNDVESLSRYFQPLFDGDDLVRVPNWNAVVRTLIGGVPTQPFSMAGLPPLGSPNKSLGDALKQLSAAKYGRPKSVVESEIFARLATKDDDKPTFSGGANGPKAGPTRPSASATPKTGSSFLDEWINKKQTNSFKMPASPFKQVPGQPAPAAQQLGGAPMTPVAAPQPPQSVAQPMSQPAPQLPPVQAYTQPQPQPLPIQQVPQSQPQEIPQTQSGQDEGVILLHAAPKPIPTVEEALANSGEIQIDENGQFINREPGQL